MHRTLAFVIIAGALIPLAGCGAKKRCTEKTPASFATFLEDDWRAYCSDYREHVESPGNFTMLELTEFLGDHPAAVKELNKSLYQHEKYETCFQSSKEELELRTLQACLQDNDQTDIEITNAWMSQADPWVAELQFRVQEVSPRVSDAEREAKRQMTKVSEAFEFSRRLDENNWESLDLELRSIGKALEAIEGVDEQFKAVVAKAAGHEPLLQTMETQIGPKINVIAADVGSLRNRHKDLTDTGRYLEFASQSAGVKCPKSNRKARKELKIAKKIVGSRNAEVAGGGVRILTPIRPDAKGDVDYERFEGLVCGVRGPENQFEGAQQLCGQYRFVVERQKPSSEKKYGDWRLKSFEESGPSGGVDCGLKKK